MSRGIKITRGRIGAEFTHRIHKRFQLVQQCCAPRSSRMLSTPLDPSNCPGPGQTSCKCLRSLTRHPVLTLCIHSVYIHPVKNAMDLVW